jgi:DNA modification methylase
VTCHVVINGDARRLPLADGVAQCCVTSPPYYGLRDYGADGQIGLEQTPADYVAAMVAVFRDVRRVLADDGCAWLNIGDSYASSGQSGKQDGINEYARRERGGDDNGPKQHARVYGRAPTPDNCKPKDLIGIPWMLAFALRADGWYLRQDIIWHKPNPMPESVQDRCTKAHEYIFLMSKSQKYYYDHEAITEKMEDKPHAPGNKKLDAGRNDHDSMSKVWGASGQRNLRTVWTINPRPFPGAHFATMPPELAERCIKAGSRPGDLVIDPFTGAGTTGAVAVGLGRRFAGTEINPTYAAMARRRIERPHATVERPGRDSDLPLFNTREEVTA